MENRERERRRMVDTQIAARGMRDLRVLDAMRAVPREAFVDDGLVEFAYYDTALPIDEEQIIAQPYIVARMLEALELSPDDVVLEIGAGSGYHAALLSLLAHRVYSLEKHEMLADAARARLKKLDYTNVEVVHAEGTLGFDE